MPTIFPRNINNADSHPSDVGSLFVYPTSTRVRIVGNKRTHPSLTGQEGIVIKTVRLGGWHWLQLGNGMTIKIQRNALCLAENSSGNGCFYACDKRANPRDNANRFGCSESSTGRIRSSGGINLHKLSTEALFRYAEAHGLTVGPEASRALLLEHVWWHFESSITDESSVLTHLTAKGWE